MIAVAYLATNPWPTPKPAALVSAYAFGAPTALPGGGARIARDVHRDYAPNNGWISSVGAAVSLGDLRNSGRPDTCVLVDPRDDRVTLIRLEPSGDSFVAEEIDELTPPPPDAANADSKRTWAPMGSVIGDFDADGWMDVLVYYWGRLPVAFKNPRGGSWKQTGRNLPAAILGGDAKWFTNCVCQADIDGDGRPDLVIGNYFPSTAEVLNPNAETKPQKMQSSMSRALNGGRKYVLLNSSDDKQISFRHAPIEIEDDDSSDAESRSIKILDGWTLAIAAGDLDGDFLPEIYLANDFGEDRLLVNRSTPGQVKFRVARGTPEFSVPRSKTLGRDSFKGMGVDFVTLRPSQAHQPSSILVSNIAEEWALLESHFAFEPTVPSRREMRANFEKGVAAYRDNSENLGLARSGWAWDIKAADFNNDGCPEVVQALGFLQGDVNQWAYLQELATGNDYNLRHLWAWPYFRTDESPKAKVRRRQGKLSGDSRLAFFARLPTETTFVDIGADLRRGTQPVFRDKMVSRGIAVGDIDHDGRIDFVLANQWEDSFAYRNAAAAAGNFVGVRVVKRAGDNPAPLGVHTAATFAKKRWTATPVIGARVVLEDQQRLVVGTAVIDGGNGHSGRRPAEAHFGVGMRAITERLTVQVQWRGPQPTPGNAPVAERQDDPFPAREGWTAYPGIVCAAPTGQQLRTSHPLEDKDPTKAVGIDGWWVVVVGDESDGRKN